MKKTLIETIKVIKDYDVWTEIAFSQIRTRYARTIIGPLWELIGLVVLLVPMSLLWSNLWTAPKSDFFIYLFTGYSIFRFISVTIGDASTNFMNSYSAIIKNINIHPLVCILSLCFRNFIYFFHIIIFIFIISFFFHLKINFILLSFFLLCLFLTIINVSTFVAFLCCRYRDLSNLISLCMTLIFFFTPIIWDVKQLPVQYKILLIEPNILYHYIEFFRSSLINGNVNRLSFLIVIIFTFLSSLLNLYIFKKFKKRLVLWM